MKYSVEIQNILNDRISGSIGIVNRLLQAFEKQLLNPNLGQREFRSLVVKVRAELRHFAAVENLCRDLLVRTEAPNPFPSVIAGYFSEYKAYWDQSIDHITKNIENLCDLNSKTILTHSNSNTILSLMEKLKGLDYNFRVIQTLSTPGEEGRSSLGKLNRLNIEVLLIEDSEVVNYMDGVNYVFIGCDTLLEHEFLNKTGTFRILKAAVERKVPVILITESRKEIQVKNWKNHINSNPLFEWSPLSFVTRIVNEKPL